MAGIIRLPAFCRDIASRVLACVAVLLLPAGMAGATELVIATSAGEISYDRDALREMQTTEITTTTPWTDGEQVFLGVPLSLLIDAPDDAFEMEMRAINDYVVVVPSDAVSEEYPIVAFEQNGAPMSLRDKGPFWLIYPFDDRPEYQTETMYSRSIWQLVKITVLD
jgi:hypothetical protein